MSRKPIDLPPRDELEAAILDCIKEYREHNLLSIVGKQKRRTKSGYAREYICATEIHAMLAKRGIKRSKTTVSRRIKEFQCNERKDFDIAIWVDEMDDAMDCIRELANRMDPEFYAKHLELLSSALSHVGKIIQPWALDRARSADDNETLARLVKYGTEYFCPDERKKTLQLVPNPPGNPPKKTGTN